MSAREFYLEAQKLAAAAFSPDVLPVHLLYGLCIDQSGLGSKVLHKLGITKEIVRRQVIDEVENSRSCKLVMEELPPSVECKLALERAWNSALTMGSITIETEHVLLGLTQVGALNHFGSEKEITDLEERVRELIRISKLEN